MRSPNNSIVARRGACWLCRWSVLLDRIETKATTTLALLPHELRGVRQVQVSTGSTPFGPRTCQDETACGETTGALFQCGNLTWSHIGDRRGMLRRSRNDN
jgi:hypothetical protein